MTRRPTCLFDNQDADLVDLTNEFADRGVHSRPERLRRLFNTALHPRGVKELAASRQERIAYAVIRLLDSLDSDLANERLTALAALRDEIVNGSAHHNTGRVLLEKMKHLVRERRHPLQQLECAHDFFAAASGRRAVVRRLLDECHLLEMAETWNQVAFDHHVHDAHTKGRKAPTHLVVDAWIKGIREMTVVYYDTATLEAIHELVEAAELMGIVAQPGIEVSAPHRGRFAQLIWTPLGLEGAREYVDFFSKPPVRALFDEGAEIVRYRTRQVLALLDSFNRTRLEKLRDELGLDLKPLDREEFLRFVGPGQPAKSHLADFLHQELVACGKAMLPALRSDWRASSGAARRAIEERVARLEALGPDLLARDYLAWNLHPEVENPNAPNDGAHVPPAMRRSCAETLARLDALRSGSSITLNPSGLTAADVLEILYDGKGAITHLEIFNLKDYHRGPNPETAYIGRLRRVLNSGNSITCKRMVKEILQRAEQSDEEPAARRDRLEKLHHILADLDSLLARYRRSPLTSRVGSDSVGRGETRAGMGLALMPTLPRYARAQFRRHPGSREIVPVRSEAVLRTTWRPRHSHLAAVDLLLRGLRRVPGLKALGYERDESWVVLPNATALAEKGNILTLGGTPEHPAKRFPLEEPVEPTPRMRWRYLNSNVKNLGKIFLGLAPAFLTFYLTKDWWVLAYLGAFIWFGITGLRNIVQSVFGGGGLFRSELLHWRDLVSWSRVTDSLLFTGFSVPLLDWLVKSVLLQRGLGVTTATAPLALYSGLALANGLYLFSHNMFRGLPVGAAVGNLFRSVLSIPIAFGINVVLVKLLQVGGLELAAANLAIQHWAAIIGKLASDIVAGFIEGTADRSVNVRQRFKDYTAKLSHLLDVHGRLEVLFPEIDVVDRLASPKEFFRTIGKEAEELERQQVINALDLMYFWMYQPRARPVFEDMLEQASADERRIVLLTQRLLERDRPISAMFLDDLVGKTYDRALAFYLAGRKEYLADMRDLARKYRVEWSGPRPEEDSLADIPIAAPRGAEPRTRDA